ncbi:MAG: family 10 glycosylhydrolase, partial [Lachnospiraceae bacterium]|nr:family 10 glycosylhydrolase [Lachnospiraceae bacterium]
PLAYMVQSAHKKGLEIHAWLNPYRVMSNNMKTSYLASANPAKKWMNAKSSTKRRNVLSFDGAKYYNPAKRDVRNLIVNGVKEIVQKYDVDGIHFDDYFYPALGSNYKNNFDAKEYNAYKNACKKNKKNAMSIISWRRNNVNLLLKDVYSSIKKIDKNVSFGVSPAGNINNLYASDRYYCDVKKWMGTTGYVDYICPQVYWSFTNKYCPYTSTVKRWASIKKSANVKLFIGLAAYRAGISKSEARAIGDIGWSKSKQELKKQVVTARKYKKVSGFVFYRYDNMVSSKTKTEIQNLKRVLK